MRTALPMAPGVEVKVTLKLPGLAPVIAEGQVVRRVSPQAGDRPGLGVRFDQVCVGDECLRDFLGLTLLKDSEQPDICEPSAFCARAEPPASAEPRG